MNTMELVHFVSTGERPPQRPVPAAAPHSSELARPARGAMVRARQFLLSTQRSDGSWHSLQSGDASLASQLIFLLTYLEQDSLIEQAAATILAQQSRNGGWSRMPGGPADLSISVQAYFALKLSGLGASDERMARARVLIRQLGGADAADGITRYFLALFGQIGYDVCPAVRPESSLREKVCTPILAPLALVWSHRAVRQVGIERGVRELFIAHPGEWPMVPLKFDAYGSRIPVLRLRLRALVEWTLSVALGYSDRMGWTPLRNFALQRTESTLLKNFEPTIIAGLDFGELVWHAIALRAVGFSHDSHEVQLCEKRFSEFVQGDDASSRAQPRLRCTIESDTIVALQSLGASGLAPNHPCAADAAKWLRKQARQNRTRLGTVEVAQMLRAALDASGSRPPNEPLPCVHVMRDGAGHSRPNPHRDATRLRRFVAILVRHLVEQQNPDGGWGIASGSPSAADATAAVLEVLGKSDFETPLPVPHRDRARGSRGIAQAVLQAVEFLRVAQRADGSWDSATGVRFVHGTALAVRGLLAAGVSRDDDAVVAGINWLIVHQHPSGGWGESAISASDGDCDEFVAGPATASQTAWALLALVAADRSSSEAVRRGIHFLLETQDDDGSWHETRFVHYDTASSRWFRSDLRSVADPLLTLSHWAVAAEAACADETDRVPLRLVSAMIDD